MEAHLHQPHHGEPARIPAPDPQRRILILAMVALIREQFRAGPLVGGAEARGLLHTLAVSGLAAVDEAGGLATVEMMGVRARSNGGAHALLSEWIRAAQRRIEGVA